MLPSSSSQLARYGQINHYKKFWLLQTQLEKQDQSSTSLSLQGATGNTNIPTVVKENKPLSSSLTVHGDHNTVGHGSCRAVLDIGASSSTSCSTSRGGANFPYPTSIEPSITSMKFYTNGLCHPHSIESGNVRDSPPLSLAVNCENVAHINFVWPSAPPLQPNSVSDAQLRPPTSAKFLSSHPGNGVPRQVLVSSVATEDLCVSSECSTGGEKRAGYWDSFHSCTTTQQITPAPSEVPTPASSSLRSVANGSASVLRTCSLCGTTKTPLWRSGPDGPKSLCNACGIRVKKSKRLQAAMEAAGGDVQQLGSCSSSPSSSYKRLQLSTTSKSAGQGGALKRKHSIQATENASDPIYQKRKKMVGYRSRSICWSPSSLAELRCSQDGGFFSGAGEGTAKLAAGTVMDRKSSSKDIMSNMFAKDVEEAAVLLMALSCGLVLS